MNSAPIPIAMPSDTTDDQPLPPNGASTRRNVAWMQAGIIDHLALPALNDPASAAQRCRAVAAARTAALSDEAGKALDLTLQQHGAPARPVKAQPIRWQHNPRLKVKAAAPH